MFNIIVNNLCTYCIQVHPIKSQYSQNVTAILTVDLIQLFFFLLALSYNIQHYSKKIMKSQMYRYLGFFSWNPLSSWEPPRGHREKRTEDFFFLATRWTPWVPFCQFISNCIWNWCILKGGGGALNDMACHFEEVVTMVIFFTTQYIHAQNDTNLNLFILSQQYVWNIASGEIW